MRRHPTRSRGKSQAPGTKIEDRFAERVRAAECTLVAAGWRDPVALNDEALKAGLSGEHFFCDVPRYLFAYLILAAELGFRPCVATGDAVPFLDAARRAGLVVREWDVWEALFYFDWRSALLAGYVEDVIRLADRRREIAKLHKTVDQLLRCAIHPAPMTRASSGVSVRVPRGVFLKG